MASHACSTQNANDPAKEPMEASHDQDRHECRAPAGQAAMKMKTFFITCATVALLAGPARAGKEIWFFNNYKTCIARTEFKLYPKETKTDEWPLVSLERRETALGPRGGPAPSVLEEPDTAIVTFEHKHLAKLEAAVRFLKKCRPWAWDRQRGKAVGGKPVHPEE
jgi:hypothetical protein